MNKKPPRIETYLDYLYKMDYKERPVSIEQFLSDEKYFGKLTDKGRSVFPIWKTKLDEFLNEDSKYLIILTGAIGIGKTRAAIYAVGYVMYRLLCLKNPWDFFGRAAGGRMCIAFFNLTKSLGQSRAFDILQQHLINSEWFLKKGIVTGNTRKILDIPLFEYALSSPLAAGFGVQGKDIILAIMDEVDSPTASDKLKQRVLQAYESTVLRFESRFVDDVYKESIGKFFLVASKQEQHSFLDAFITEHKEAKNTYIADIKYWETREQGTYSGKTFPVMLGDVYMPSKILSSEQEKQNAIQNGYQIVDVPVEFYESFERNLVGSLRDIAGISTVGLRRSKLFPSERSILDCYDETKPDPANLTTIELGLNDELDLIKFLDLSKIRVPKHHKRFIHCDIAFSGDGDALSIAMSSVKDWVRKDIENPDGTFDIQKVPVVETDFAIRLKGHPGDEVPIYRVRKLVLDLRAAGFNVHFSADLVLLSKDTEQILSRSKIPCSYLSLDKTISPYLTFRELVHEQRWVFHKSNMLHFELANLEYDKDRQKIDHPHKVETLQFLEDGGTKELVVLGSKDLSDAVAGSVYNAVLSAPAVPLETSAVKKLGEQLRKSAQTKEWDWVLETTEAINQPGGLQQYLLQNKKDGKYWMWSQENPAVLPSLTGPFEERLVNLEVIPVDNPAMFRPSGPTAPPSSQHQAKLNILKIASGR